MKPSNKLKKWISIFFIILCAKAYIFDSPVKNNQSLNSHSAEADKKTLIDTVLSKTGSNIKDVIAEAQKANLSENYKRSQTTMLKTVVAEESQDSNISTLASYLMDKALNELIAYSKSANGQKILEKIILASPDPVKGSYNIEKFSEWSDGLYNNNTTISHLSGYGENIKCGQKVVINYKIRNFLTDKIIDSKNEFTFRLGEKKLIPGLEYMVMGMRKKSIKTAIVPPKLAYSHESPFFDDNFSKEYVFANAEIIEIKDKTPDLSGLITASKNRSNKKFAICGNKVKIKYQLFDGKKPLSKSQAKEIILGSIDLPIAINILADGLSYGEERVATISKASSKSFQGGDADFFPPSFLNSKSPIMKISLVEEAPKLEENFEYDE